MKVFVVIPALNEERAIGRVLESLAGVFDNVVVVSDGSIDQTARIARGFAGVAVLEHAIRRGQGAALQTGNDWALAHGAEAIVHFDADGQHDLQAIYDLLAPIEAGEADVVLGSRFLGKSNVPFLRSFFLKGAIGFQWMLTGLRLTDAHNGLRALSRHAAQKIRITQDYMAHNTEIPIEIARHNLRVREIPVTLQYTQELKVRAHYEGNLKRTLLVLKDLFKGRVVR